MLDRRSICARYGNWLLNGRAACSAAPLGELRTPPAQGPGLATVPSCAGVRGAFMQYPAPRGGWLMSAKPRNLVPWLPTYEISIERSFVMARWMPNDQVLTYG